MNKEVNLSISTLKVEIKVLVLDGKRFTKSVFDQLQKFPMWDWQAREFDFGEFTPIGFCDISKERWVLFASDGVLYKGRLYEIERAGPIFEHDFEEEESMDDEPRWPIGMPIFYPNTSMKVRQGVSQEVAYWEQVMGYDNAEELMKRFRDHLQNIDRWRTLQRDYKKQEHLLKMKRNEALKSLPLSPKDQIFISI